MDMNDGMAHASDVYVTPNATCSLYDEAEG